MANQAPWHFTRSVKRNEPLRDERKKYLIVTEGKTEKAYVQHYQISTGLDIVVSKHSADKLRFMKKAVSIRKQRAESGNYDGTLDQTWVVLDRDVDRSNSKDRQNFIDAIQYAHNENIEVAYSNDSFELWYLLHFQDLSTETLRQDLCKKLSEHLKRSYKKGSNNKSLVEDLYKEIKENRPVAMKRADRLLNQSENIHPADSNPSTSVHILIQQIQNEMGFREA